MARKPVIYIPGFPASKLHHTTLHRDIFPPTPGDLLPGNREQTAGRLVGPDDPDSEQVITTSGVIKAVEIFGFPFTREADTLYHILRRFGYTEGRDFRPVPWDWRLPVYHRTVRDRVRTTIEELHREYGQPVVVLAHSTGGLVIRALLEETSATDGGALARKVDHVVGMGVPWAGTLKTLRYVGIGAGEAGLNKDQMRRVIGGAWAAFDLMPPDPARTALQDDAGNLLRLYVDAAGNQVGPLVDRRWMAGRPEWTTRADASNTRLGRRATSFSLPQGVAPVPVTNLCGWGVATETTYELDGAGTRMKPYRTDEGDGTVPFASAAWLRGPGVRTFAMPLGLSSKFLPEYHSQIWDTPQSIEVLQSVLAGGPLSEVIAVALDTDAVRRGGPVIDVRVGALDAQGRPLPQATVRFAPVAGHGTRRVDLSSGRAMLRYRVGPRPPSGQYRVPVIIEWNENGQTERRDVDRFFHF